jgi:hypothetical protein
MSVTSIDIDSTVLLHSSTPAAFLFSKEYTGLFSKEYTGRLSHGPQIASFRGTQVFKSETCATVMARKGYRPSAIFTALMMRSLLRSDNAFCSIGPPLGGATTVATSASHSSLKAMESARPAAVPRENTV